MPLKPASVNRAYRSQLAPAPSTYRSRVLVLIAVRRLVPLAEPAFADFVFEMNDWLCTLQYQNMDSRRDSWNGGFMPWVDGKAVPLVPRSSGAR